MHARSTAAFSSESFTGLDKIIVHRGRKAFFPVALHGVGRHRNDINRLGAVGLFQQPDLPRGFVTIHLRHLAIHQNHVVAGALDGLKRFAGHY